MPEEKLTVMISSTARAHLAALSAPEPDLPPFDESKFEPMVEVEIDPEDEYHVGSSL
jgi:hypothetical protein